MTKKEFLEKILEPFEDTWPLWKALLILLKNDELEWSSIDSLVQIMEESMKSVESDLDKERIQRWIDLLKRREELDNKKNESDLSELESMLDTI